MSPLERGTSSIRCTDCGATLRLDRETCPVCSGGFKPISKEEAEKNELIQERRKKARENAKRRASKETSGQDRHEQDSGGDASMGYSDETLGEKQESSDKLANIKQKDPSTEQAARAAKYPEEVASLMNMFDAALGENYSGGK